MKPRPGVEFTRVPEHLGRQQPDQQPAHQEPTVHVLSPPWPATRSWASDRRRYPRLRRDGQPDMFHRPISTTKGLTGVMVESNLIHRFPQSRTVDNIPKCSSVSSRYSVTGVEDDARFETPCAVADV